MAIPVRKLISVQSFAHRHFSTIDHMGFRLAIEQLHSVQYRRPKRLGRMSGSDGILQPAVGKGGGEGGVIPPRRRQRKGFAACSNNKRTL